jgi:hypothetical protein
MIIFYNKNTGIILGTIEGRVHNDLHLKMWIGDKTEIHRLVVQWKPTGKEIIHITNEPIFEEYIDEEGFTETRQIGVKKKKTKTKEFQPDHEQVDIFKELDKTPSSVYNYKVDTKTKKLIPK